MRKTLPVYWKREANYSRESVTLLVGRLSLGAIRRDKGAKIWTAYTAFDLGSSPEYQNPHKFENLEEAQNYLISAYVGEAHVASPS